MSAPVNMETTIGKTHPTLVIDNSKKTLIDNPDVKFWFVLGPEFSKMPGIAKSEPRLDPAFLDVSEKNLKSPTNKTVTSHNQSKKSISPHEGVIEYECRPVNSIPNKLYNYSNPMTLNLPTKERLYYILQSDSVDMRDVLIRE